MPSRVEHSCDASAQPTTFCDVTGRTARLVPALATLILLIAAATAVAAPGIAPTLLALAGGVLALGYGIFCLRRARQAEADLAAERNARLGLASLLDGAPDPWCGWDRDGTPEASPGLPALLGIDRLDRPEHLERALLPPDAAAVRHALSHLREAGTEFQLTVATADGARRLQLTGRRGTAEGRSVDLVWARDVTSLTAEAERQHRLHAQAERLVEELRTALDVVPYPVWLRRPDLSLAWVNKAYAKALDIGQEAATETQRELTAGIPGASGRLLAEQAYATGIAQSQTLHLVIGGQRHLNEITEAPLRPPGAEQQIVIGYALDHTEREELRTELSRHVAAHAEVLEQLGSAIAIFGADTRLKFFNRAYLQLWGFDEAWLESEPTYAEVLEDLRARRRLPEHADFVGFKRDQLALFTSLLEPAEDLEHLPDGTALRRLSVPHPLGGLMFILEDVTTTLALETSYNTLMAVQQETLDNLAEGIAVFGGDGRLKLSNPAYARIWKLDNAELIGEPHVVELFERMKDFFDYGDDWEGFKDEMVGNTLERTARSGRIERADGSVIEFANVPLPDGAVLNSFLDVTDSVRVEQALRERNAALETADRLKAEFLANVSYQLRTPLNAIMGFAEILANEYFGPLNERQMEYCAAVLESGRRLLLLINDILDLATVEAGFLVLERNSVDLAALLQSVAGLTREWARKQNLRIEIEHDEALGRIDADEKRLKQALFNLISNSIKFTPPGGSIVLSGRREGSWVELTVKDTGVGIPPADQHRVFERFERANAHTRQAGAGLGLSLVKSLVELHGGRIEIESRVNEGTVIRCLLPTDAAGSTSPPPSPAGRDERPEDRTENGRNHLVGC